MRHNLRLQRISQQNLGTYQNQKTWEKFEQINDDLKQEVKEVSSSLLQSVVESNLAVLELFTLMS